uniref:RING-type domain-containing protein n=1 Tax=Esox lucius TaxID=8010 RepID=A0A6Q2WUX4_ESOLU
MDSTFDIPQVDTPPTLESILNEPEEEEEPFILEDTSLMNTESIDAHSCETSSLASSDSGDRTHLKRKRKTLELHTAIHGSVLRHSILKGISAQIVSAADKVDAGLPTAVVNLNQALRLCLGSTATGAEYGAVSALSINHDCTRLLCGFAKGQITMWDLANGKLLRTITDANPPGSAILHVKFTDDPTLAVCNDSGGSVFELAFRRVMGMRTCDSRCLFSGSKGEVCNVEPLHTPPDLKDHPITQYSLLAMASLTKILVIGLKPSLKVWMTFPYGKADPSSIPQLAWQFVPVQKAVNPVLAFCRGVTVHFLLVKKDDSGTIHVIKQRQLQLDCDIISLSWIDSRTLVAVDSGEKLRVVDRPSQEELETIDMAEVQLVYNSSHFKSLATGGNVSQALALVGEKACYQSVCSYAGQIVILGTKSAHVMTLRSWRERVDFLLKQERFVEALSLAWSFHEGTAKAVLGEWSFFLPGCNERLMEQHFLDVVPVVVDYCLLLQRTDLLFSQLYGRLGENCVARGVFLESLEPYIVSERLGCLNAAVMKDLLAHLQDNNMMDSIGNCLVHMDITSLDIQQVVQMCWTNQLYDAMIYVFNRGINDYINPMEKLFQVITPPLRQGRALTDEQVVMGNKLLVYISCCLAGRAYPLGDIPEDLVSQVKNQVFEFLIGVHSADAGPDEDMYPYIRTLLHFDTREFLNVLALTFEDFKNDKQALEYQQRIVDILLKVMVENSDFTPSQVGCLFTFLARQLAKPDNTLFVNRKLFDQVLEFLCCPDDDSRHTERQQVLLELLQAGGVVQFDEGRLLRLAEKAEFYQICEFLYEQKHQYDKIIDCYLRDPLRKGEVFNYIHNLLSIPGYSSEEKQCVWNKALQHIQVDTEGPHPQALLKLSPDLNELHISLMCRFAPRQLTDFLKSSQEYRLEEAIQVTTLLCVCVCVCVCFIYRVTAVYSTGFSLMPSPPPPPPLCQDPVYGKGKLAEIQGLILGMLETFNYEQTLLETTTSLLNHDLHWSLSHLRAVVSKGLHPRQDQCNICLQQYKRRHDSPEQIIVFSCGHLYHCHCLQRKGRSQMDPRLFQAWSCYKCTSSQGGRGGDRGALETGRGRNTSLAQVFVETTLDPQQSQSWDQLRSLYRGPSRLAILSEISHCHGNEKSGLLNPAQPGTGSIFHSENFQLKLSPPPLVEE